MVAALFVRKDSIYRQLGADCFDLERDARTFDLSCPVVAHPPCRAWAKLRGFAKPRPDEKDLARWAMHVVRYCGGVLEHPRQSDLWREAGVCSAGVRDAFGGVLVTVDQVDYGHPCKKPTGLYIVGAPLPSPPYGTGVATHEIAGKGAKRGALRAAHKAMREHTPRALAVQLLDLARLAA